MLELFGHLSSDFDDLHKGVFVSPKPLVAYSYASSRQVVGDNEYGVPDVLDPPVLIGLNIPEDELLIDTDGVTTAMNLLKFTRELVASGESWEDLEDLEWGEVDVSDYSRMSYYDMSEFGPAFVGGDVGNRPSSADFLEAIQELVGYLQAEQVDTQTEIQEYPEEALNKALELAKGIIPQFRILREVDEDAVEEIIVLPPIMEPSGKTAEYPTTAVTDYYEFLEEEGVDQLNDLLTEEIGKRIHGLGTSDQLYWHGTSLSIARMAFPSLFEDSVDYADAVRKGSAYDLELMELEYGEREEEEEEEEDDEEEED